MATKIEAAASTTQTPREPFEGRCMRCKKQVTARGRYELTPNGKGLMRGKCPICQTVVCRLTKVR